MKFKKEWWISLSLGIVLMVLILCVLAFFPQRTYLAEDFEIKTVRSTVDFDSDGIDDYSDFLKGAKKEAKNKPRYDGAYQQGGYPPAEIGVCSDVVWRSFREAGYNLKAMIDQDIAAHPLRYPNIQKPDPNIDFRRVKNLLPFFRAYAVELTTAIDKIDQWQPGDIVVFNDAKHIGMVSDLRNKKGQPYIIHNGGQLKLEEDYLPRADVMAHFRFDASLLPKTMLMEW